MRYEINGIEIQKLKLAGVPSYLKAYRSHTTNDLNTLKNAAWDSAIDSEDNKICMSIMYFPGVSFKNIYLDFVKTIKKNKKNISHNFGRILMLFPT